MSGCQAKNILVEEQSVHRVFIQSAKRSFDTCAPCSPGFARMGKPPTVLWHARYSSIVSYLPVGENKRGKDGPCLLGPHFPRGCCLSAITFNLMFLFHLDTPVAQALPLASWSVRHQGTGNGTAANEGERLLSRLCAHLPQLELIWRGDITTPPLGGIHY